MEMNGRSNSPGRPETEFLGTIVLVARPSMYPRELGERAVRIVAEVRPDYPSEYTAVAQMLRVESPETIRTIRRCRVGVGACPGVRTEAAEGLKRLRRENAELRRANEILKAACAVFAAELDRPQKP